MRNKTWFCIDCRVPMVWRPGGFQKCPICDVEVWYPAGDKRPKEAAIEQLNAKMAPECLSRAYIPGACGPGGSDPTGRTKTEKMNKPSCQQEYNRLFKQV